MIFQRKIFELLCYNFCILLCFATATTFSNVIFMKKINLNFYTALKILIFNLGVEELFRYLSTYNVSDSVLHLQAEPILCDLAVNKCQLNYMRNGLCFPKAL